MKKILWIFSVAIFAVMISFLTRNKVSQLYQSENSTGRAYIYGEKHGQTDYLEAEINIWNEYYNEYGMRHLFVELPMYTAELLNIWMNSDSDEILDEIFADIKGTAMDTVQNREFYKTIKSKYPYTIFHGVDVGHQYKTTGERYIKYLKDNNLEDSYEFEIAVENINQGMAYYEKIDRGYRENLLVQNFIREFNRLEDQDIMGIFGRYHTDDNIYVEFMVPNMTGQLKSRYGNNIISSSVIDKTK